MGVFVVVILYLLLFIVKKCKLLGEKKDELTIHNPERGFELSDDNGETKVTKARTGPIALEDVFDRNGPASGKGPRSVEPPPQREEERVEGSGGRDGMPGKDRKK